MRLTGTEKQDFGQKAGFPGLGKDAQAFGDEQSLLATVLLVAKPSDLLDERI